ncbi:hypothetical protein C8Q76DRAFT_327186 [Earliella scabrosa]|nr:hypothetical protein C8Q76DRAFT_327186 [Earliella scabrosa]
MGYPREKLLIVALWWNRCWFHVLCGEVSADDRSRVDSLHRYIDLLRPPERTCTIIPSSASIFHWQTLALDTPNPSTDYCRVYRRWQVFKTTSLYLLQRKCGSRGTLGLYVLNQG